MKRTTAVLTTFAIALYLSTVPLFPQQHGGGHGGSGGHGPTGTHGPTGGGHGSGGKGKASATTAGKSAGSLSNLKDGSKLSTNLENLLHLSGSTAFSNLQADAKGFKNMGQFVAAVHVSNNLGIDFNTLKATMLGTKSGTKPMSLGQAIKQLDPKADAKAEAKKATKQAHDDVEGTEPGS